MRSKSSEQSVTVNFYSIARSVFSFESHGKIMGPLTHALSTSTRRISIRLHHAPPMMLVASGLPTAPPLLSPSRLHLPWPRLASPARSSPAPERMLLRRGESSLSFLSSCKKIWKSITHANSPFLYHVTCLLFELKFKMILEKWKIENYLYK
jgi:hypothetical protein